METDHTGPGRPASEQADRQLGQEADGGQMKINRTDPDRFAYQQLADWLRKQITSGRIAPGTPIPSKRQLRTEFGISGQTVDKACDILRDEGRIKTAWGLGLFVTSPDEWRD